MNEYDLFDAIGGIDDELLSRSERRAVRKFPIRKAIIAAAAVMALAVTVMAAPSIRAFLFPSAPVQTSEGKRHIYGELYKDIKMAEYRIDLKVGSTASLPSEVEEVRLPHYMIENNWLVSYGEIDARNSEGPVHFKWWDRESPKWVTFEQLCISAEGVTFRLETYHSAELRQESVTVGELELQYLNIPGYTNRETWEFYPEATAVYWSDGEYAYHLECSSDVTEEELAQIVARSAGILDVDIVDEGAYEIARRSRGTPRIANRFLRRVRDFAQVCCDGVITKEAADMALQRLEVDHLGLDTIDRRMLTAIIRNYNGGPVGLETLAATIGEEAVTLEDVYEPYLMQLGFLTRTPRGRCVTVLAYDHLKIPYQGQMQLPL